MERGEVRVVKIEVSPTGDTSMVALECEVGANSPVTAEFKVNTEKGLDAAIRQAFDTLHFSIPFLEVGLEKGVAKYHTQVNFQ